MDDLIIKGFIWNDNNEAKVFRLKPDRAYLTKEDVESVLQDPHLYYELYGQDTRRGTPTYLCIGRNNQGGLMRVIFKLTKDELARIFHAHPIRDKKWRTRYEGKT